MFKQYQANAKNLKHSGIEPLTFGLEVGCVTTTPKYHLIFNSYLFQIHYPPWDRGVVVTHPTSNPKVRGSNPGARHFLTILKQLWELQNILWNNYGCFRSRLYSSI